MEEKSFLDSLAKEVNQKKEVEKQQVASGQTKPGSFQEEVFHRVDQPKEKNKKVWIISGVVAILSVVAIWFLFFAPKITMPDFEGQKLSDVSAWAKQYEISNSSIVVKREYNFDYEEDQVISQSQNAGSKIKKDTPLTFVVSNGADPNELISFPDIKSMTKEEVEEWIDKNKLQKTKVSAEYHATIPEGQVISYDLKFVDEGNFARGSNLTVSVSRGVAPLKEVTIVDYVGKTFEEFKTWADSKKLVIEKVESYNKGVEAGKIVSQSLSSGTVVKEGDTIRVVVSQGEATVVPNLVGYTDAMLSVWIAENPNIQVIKQEKYDKSSLGTVISQSIASGTVVEKGEVVVITTSLYMPQLMTNSQEWKNKDYLELLSWVDDVNAKGGSIAAGVWGGEICPDEAATAGQILEVKCMDKDGNQLPYNENGCARPLPLNAKISMTIVKKGCPVISE